MRVEIDPASDVPLYQQLRDRIVEAIAAGRLRPGEPLAPVRQVAGQFGINPATVGKGYDMLRQEGLVRTNRRSGSVVARGPQDPPAADAASFAADWRSRLCTLLAEAVAQGVTPEEARVQVAEILDGFAGSAGDTNDEEA